MGQFKPMVKMETTEPSVILKLKKGGHVNMKDGGKAESGHKKMAGGGAMEMLGMTPAFVGRPAVNAPVKSPGKPSMSARKKAMSAKKKTAMAKKPPMPPKDMPMMPPMKKGGSADKSQDKAMIKKAFKQHDAQEHKGGKGTKLALKKGGMMSGGKACATGGVVNGNGGGFKTGGVAMANAGGYATGGVAMSNAGGYKDGGKTSKKAYATGGTVNTGKPVAMQEGNKPIPAPKRQQNFSGTYKDGGEVAKKSTGGRMGQKPAQTIRTAPIGTSMATRDIFASRGKRPSYKDGGKVPKMAMGGMFRNFGAQVKNMPAAPMNQAPSIDGVKARAMQQAQATALKSPTPSVGEMQAQMAAAERAAAERAAAERARKSATPPASQNLGPANSMGIKQKLASVSSMGPQPIGGGLLKRAMGRKEGGDVGNKSLQKINEKQNAPAVKASKADVNLKYPETMNSPQKTPKLKC